MTELHVYLAQNVNLSTLRNLLSTSEVRWFYAERMEDVALEWAPDVEAQPSWPQKWSEGRAFGAAVEVDWWREREDEEHANERYRLRYLSTGPAPQVEGVTWETGPTLSAIGSERRVILRGELDESSAGARPTWSEARTPHHIAYPVAPDEEIWARRVALIVQDYGSDGITSLTRLLRVVGHVAGDTG